MQKLLIVTRWYLPAVKSGGTVRSIHALVMGLKDDFELTILTSDRDLGSTVPYENVEFDKLMKIHDNVSIVYLSKLNQESIGQHVENIQPDILYVNSFFDITTQVIMLLKLRNKLSQQIILAPRGELAKGALSIKAKKKSLYLFFYKLFKLSKGIVFHATSQEDVLDIQKLFPSNRIKMIQNPKEENHEKHALPFKEKNKLRMVFISRIARVKNLLFALEVLEKLKITGQIVFDIYGPNEDEAYWDLCQEVIERLPSTIEVNYKGFVQPSDISSTLAGYHLFFLATKGENFGHAIVEAMQVGLIPLISDKTPWQNLESLEAGYSLALDSETLFLKAIREVLAWDNVAFTQSSTNVKQYIKNKINNKKTIDAYKVFFKKNT